MMERKSIFPIIFDNIIKIFNYYNFINTQIHQKWISVCFYSIAFFSKSLRSMLYFIEEAERNKNIK